MGGIWLLPNGYWAVGRDGMTQPFDPFPDLTPGVVCAPVSMPKAPIGTNETSRCSAVAAHDTEAAASTPGRGISSNAKLLKVLGRPACIEG